MSLTTSQLELLRRAFPPKLIERKPGQGDRRFVSHGHVTDRLIAVDPEWTWTVLKEFEYQHAEGNYWILGRMTVGGVSREEYGHGKNPMEAASHFIRRAAMRFGVALDLWLSEEASAASSPSQEVDGEPRSRTSGRDGAAENVGGGAPYGEGGDPPPASTPSAQSEGHHDHHWRPSPTLNGWQYCDVKGCGKARKRPKEAVKA